LGPGTRAFDVQDHASSGVEVVIPHDITERIIIRYRATAYRPHLDAVLLTVPGVSSIGTGIRVDLNAGSIYDDACPPANTLVPFDIAVLWWIFPFEGLPEASPVMQIPHCVLFRQTLLPRRSRRITSPPGDFCASETRLVIDSQKMIGHIIRYMPLASSKSLYKSNRRTGPCG